mgnify:CR=1 FL=1
MSFRSSSVASAVFAGLFAAACHSTPSAPCPNTQAIVESVGKEHPEVARLTVHCVPPGGGACCAVASTLAEKRGKVSDPEDLEAMGTGKLVVLDEAGGVDVTVPVMQKGARWEATVGVTFKPNPEMKKEQFVELATAIARVVEDRMVAMRK